MTEPTVAPPSGKQTTGTVPPDSGWEEHQAVTGRPVDTPAPNTTFADRAKARTRVKREVSEEKTVQSGEVTTAPKRRRK